MGFSFADPLLTITTSLMELHFKKGAVIYLKDISSGEVFVNTDITTNPPADWRDFLGYNTFDTAQGWDWYVYPSDDVTVSYPDGNTAVLTYSPCASNADPTSTVLEYTFAIDAVTGEISISMIGTMPAGWRSGGNMFDFVSADLAIMNFGYTGSSIIARCEEVAFADANTAFTTTNYNGGINSPNVALGKGTNACWAVWTENPNFLPTESININHYQSNYAHFVCYTPPDPGVAVSDKFHIYAGPWRFTTQATWLAIVKRWRARYEAVWTDAKYLWERSPTWSQDIHCRYSANHPTYTQWEDVANQGIPVTKFLADQSAMDYNGNGDFQPLYGDITKANSCTNRYPMDEEITEMTSLGIKYLGYFFHYTLVNTSGIQSRLTSKAGNLAVGWDDDPLDYDPFHPDYSGYNAGYTGPEQQADWMTYWDAVSEPGVQAWETGYNFIHLGSTLAQDTWFQIMEDFCTTYGFSGMFWDECWQDHDSLFSDSNRIQNGMTFLDGVREAAKTMNNTNGLIILSEFFSQHLAPYVLYTWEGPRTWYRLRLDQELDPIPMTHPILAALVGSYTWRSDRRLTEPTNIDDYYFEHFAYQGCIPQFCLTGESDAPTFGNEYYTARAKMFCDYEMFYDLPDTWGDVTEELAYFRTNSTAKFKFIKRATGRYAYVSADNDAYILQHELKTGESTGHKTFSDTYTSIPTVKVSSGTATNITLTGFDYTVSTTGDWIVFGTQDAPTYSRGDYVTLPSTADNLEISYTADDITAVATDDDTTYVSQSASGQYAIHEFKNDATGKSSCTVTWDGQSNLDNTLSRPTILEIYNTNTLAWEELNRNTSTLANTDFTLSFPIVGNLDDYKDANGLITCRVYQSGS